MSFSGSSRSGRVPARWGRGMDGRASGAQVAVTEEL
jgi:hypothetical protein